MRLVLAAALAVSVAGAEVDAQCSLVMDINDGPGTAYSSRPRGEWAELSGWYYFSAWTFAHGREVYRVNAAGDVRLVRDLRPGPLGSDPRQLTAFAGWIYFVASTDAHGYELRRTNGTTTELVRDIAPGAASSFPDQLTPCHGRLYFTAADASNGNELWRTAGTAATTQILSIEPGAGSSRPFYLTCCRDELLCAARTDALGTELYRVRTATTRPTLVDDIWKGRFGSVKNLRSCAGVLYFSADDGVVGQELWKAVRVVSGSTTKWVVSMVRDIRPGSEGSFPWGFVLCNGRVYFVADDGVHGSELWQSTGNAQGTQLVADIHPGAAASSLSWLTCCGTTLFFRAKRPLDGAELWRADGLRVQLVRDIQSGSDSSWPEGLTYCGNRLYFSANSGQRGPQLWSAVADRTGSWQASLVADISPSVGGLSFDRFGCVGAKVYFPADDRVRGLELWESDGTLRGTSLVRDIEPTVANGRSNAVPMACCLGALFLSAETDRFGKELWISRPQGTDQVTTLVKDIAPGPADSSPWEVTCFGNVVLFAADDGANGRELWRSDGTSRGTTMVKDIRRGRTGSFPTNLTVCGDLLYFTADDGVHGKELWRTDGTSRGTVLVDDIRRGSAGADPASLACSNGVLYFCADNGLHGAELWRTAGASVRLVRDIQPGAAGSRPFRLIACRGKVYFAADDGIHGNELWRSDGTAQGTVLIQDIYRGGGDSNPGLFVCCSGQVTPANEYLFFAARSPSKGYEAFRTNAAGDAAVLVVDARAGSDDGKPRWFRCSANGTVFWVADVAENQSDLFRSVQTGTDNWLTARVGATGIFPFASTKLALVGERVYFPASHLTTGEELWVSDGSPNGAKLVCDLNPGPSSSVPRAAVTCCGQLFFGATGRLVSRELYRVARPGASTEVLGSTCPPFHPAATSTTPTLGRTSWLRGRNRFPNQLGVVVVSRSKLALPFAVPGVTDCPLWFDVASFVTAGVVDPPSYKIALPIPNDVTLNGARWVTQTVWIDLFRVFPFQASNGVLMNLGT